MLEQLEKPHDQMDKLQDYRASCEHLNVITNVYCIQFKSIYKFSP